MQEKCYLVVKNDTITKRYECKDTRESTNTTPYIKIKAGTKSGYIDLTTQTTTGVRPQISNINTTTSTTSSRSSEYTETTGYSGVSGVNVTEGYSCTEIAWDTNQMQTYTVTQITGTFKTSYTGEVWNVNYSNSYPTKITTSTSKDIIGFITLFSQSKWNTLTGASQLKKTWNESSLTASAKINNSAYKLSTYSSEQSTTYYPYINITDVSVYTKLTKRAELYFDIMSGLWLQYPTTSSAGNQVDWTNKKITMSTTTTWAGDGGWFTNAILKSDTKTSTQSYSKTHFEGISAETSSGISYSFNCFDIINNFISLTWFHHNTTNYNFQSGNTITTKTYNTCVATQWTSTTNKYVSTRINSLMTYDDDHWFTTGYVTESITANDVWKTWDISTFLSTYSTSSIQPGNMSSTTALTTTISRSSQYNITVSSLMHYKPVNSVSVTVNRTMQSQGTYYTGVKSTTSEYTETTGYSGVSSKESTSGYTGKSKSTYNNVATSQSDGTSKLTKVTATTYNYNYSSIPYIIGQFLVADFFANPNVVKTSATLLPSRVESTTGSIASSKTITDVSFNAYSIHIQPSDNVKSQSSGTIAATWCTFNFMSFKESSYQIISLSKKRGVYYQNKNTGSASMKMSSYSQTGIKYSGFYSYTNTVNTSSNTTNAGISSTTALTRSSAYLTSSNAIGNLSSTTALTATSSRSLGYTTTTISTNSNISSTATTSGTVNYTTTVEVIKEITSTTPQPTTVNNILNVRLNGVLNK